MADSKEAACTEVTEGTDGEAVEAVSELGTSVDVGDTELIHESSHELSEQREEDNDAAVEKESEGDEAQHKETEAEAVPSVGSRSPPQAACSEETGEPVMVNDGEAVSTPESEEPVTVNDGEPVSTSESEEPVTVNDGEAVSSSESEEPVTVNDGEAVSTSESEKEAPEVKSDQELEAKAENVAVQDEGSEESPAGAAVSEDACMEATCDREEEEEERKNTDENTNMSSDTKEEDGTEWESSTGCKLKVLTAGDELDEMMDIGTVDQVEQEAQMKVEEQNDSKDAESSRSPAACNAASVVEDSNSNLEETDVKPTTSELMRSSSSSSSEATGSTGRDSSSPAAVLNGMKVVKLSIPRLDVEKLRSATQSIKLSPSPPLVTVKDEPVDEEYEHALISSSSSASVKDEPNTAREDLKIGSVFSVGSETQTLPIVSPSSLLMSCAQCKKNLMKGQTAFQRKGSPALFCSTTCLSMYQVKGATKICHNCQKLIIRPQDVILAPDLKGLMKEFCGQNCLTSFNYKKNASSYRKAAITVKAPVVTPQSLCSMCTRYCVSKHEVILGGSVHKMCSDACFNRFRTVNNLSMAGCANCGSYCHNKPLMLKMEEGSKTVCNMECLAKYKEKTKMAKITQPCTMCRTTHLLAEMVDNKNSDDSVDLFCSSSCVMAFKVQTVSSSGARINCDNCGKNTVPSYHLAMSDTSIRNFCTLPCVMAFQEKFKQSQKQVNVFTKLPVGSTQIQAVSTTQPQQGVKASQKLSCLQCSRVITFKPELVQLKDKIVFLCSVDCSHEFKKANNVMSVCEYCMIEKITRDVKRVNNKDCYFCSDGCKLLFRHDLSKNWGKHCHSCSYCHCVSKKLVTAQYGGSTEEFCSDDCRSKYTMLFCHVAKCDTCGRKGKLKQSLPMLGEVKHFCDLSCLLQFCCEKVATQGEVVKASAGEATPIIANVISLAGTPKGKPNTSDRSTQQSTASNFQSKNSGHMSIQTETVKTHPPPPAKILKNKALLCRPLVQNKGVSCKTQTVDVEAQTDEIFPKMMILPVPVPVYLPVPMNMYSQCTPKPVGLPLPLPVPMFLPVTMNSAERIVETIQEIKQKIPSDPYEAELILMAEMVAEDDENNDEQETQKEEKVKKVAEKQDAAVTDDHVSNYSDDLDTEELATFLNTWEDASCDAGTLSLSKGYASEKLNSVLDVSVGTPSEPEPAPLPGPPPMDIEADFTVETLERMARQREQSTKSPSPPPAPVRRQAHRKAREKRGRKPQRQSKAAETSSAKAASKKAAEVEIPKLKSEYGVDAWKRWIQWRQTQPNLENPRFGSRPLELKEDLLRCTTAELSYGLCCFIAEVKRPNGEPYSPDTVFYLCLGIQQYLFQNGRVENIFMDRFYSKFSIEFTNLLRGFKPSITASGYIHSRVEEEFLWDCKQLGAYSPIVLLNTLLFFCCKYFGFTKVEQHRQLSFAHVMRCTKTNPNNTKTTFLRFYPPLSGAEAESDPEGVPSKKRKEEESKEDILEMMENTENPLRCPVRLYEFYLSKCSESVKQRTNMFYLHPERCCVPNSPLWFSSTALDDSTMEAMLTRILIVRELHLDTRKDERKPQETSDDPPFIPEEEEGEDSD
ncbi:zinc finger MYM-type protein 4 isoform X2 [Archocentrus centrarchus]|uniref:zinc finger MYM-type protein 4 isoform X2 n=1 Tax=Archocentrus centrarchus TaxID=63155 RepID=UPI0011EA1D8A|nr:zinc finger MYM-type protein 4 isoform X2 [Archocentrus centrarchus]